MKNSHGSMTRHHLIARERVKKRNHDKDQSAEQLHRVLKLWSDRHHAWHYLFQNMTPLEIAKVMLRIEKITLKNPKT